MVIKKQYIEGLDLKKDLSLRQVFIEIIIHMHVSSSTTIEIIT
jgi:hypothetical protein